MATQQALLGLTTTTALHWEHTLPIASTNLTVPHFVLDYGSCYPQPPSCNLLQHHLSIYTPTKRTFQVTGLLNFNTRPHRSTSLLSSSVPSPLTLDNLDSLNLPNGSSTYFTSTVDITTNPVWLNGVKPDASGRTTDAVSTAIITVDKGNDTLDAFYIYFYAFNSGDYVLNTYLGNHVGDIEHNMIRFVNDTPTAMWYSQHTFGGAFEFSVIPKIGLRPIVYSANGTHANWATVGSHEHLILDYTSAGALWDPTLSAYYYHVDFAANATANSTEGTFTPYAQPVGTSSYSPAYCSTFNNATSSGNSSGSCAGSDHVPTAFLSFNGLWGDEQYPKSDPRQVDFLDLGVEFKYVGGPAGPLSKGLNRKDVCPDTGDICLLRTVIEPGD